MNDNVVKGTGQLLFRELSEQSPNPGQKLMMVAGIVSVPSDYPIPGEHQVPVAILEQILSDAEIFMLSLDEMIDRTEEVKGLTLDGALKTPIWKV